jgi:peptide/nickel transport system permease protein
MALYMVRRLAAGIPLVVAATLMVFFALELVPGDPAELIAGEDATPERVAEIRHELGLDRPLLGRYADWLAGLARGDLGTSLSRGMPVRELVRGALGPTVELAAAAAVLALTAGIAIGIVQAAAGGRVDAWLSAAGAVALSVPGFVVASVLLWVFAIELGWLPASGRVPVLSDPVGGMRSLALPAFTLGLSMSAVLARFTRGSVAAVLQQEYIRAARARGLPERTVLVRHALRPALAPVLTVAALQMGQLLTGALVIEQVFTRPGIGYLAVTAVRQRDVPLVQGVVVVFAAVYLLVNLAADLAAALADPRLRQ